MRGQILGVGGMPAGDPERASVECKLSELFSGRTSTLSTLWYTLYRWSHVHVRRERNGNGNGNERELGVRG